MNRGDPERSPSALGGRGRTACSRSGQMSQHTWKVWESGDHPSSPHSVQLKTLPPRPHVGPWSDRRFHAIYSLRPTITSGSSQTPALPAAMAGDIYSVSQYKSNTCLLWSSYLPGGPVLRIGGTALTTELPLVKHLPYARHLTESSPINTPFVGGPRLRVGRRLP